MEVVDKSFEINGKFREIEELSKAYKLKGRVENIKHGNRDCWYSYFILKIGLKMDDHEFTKRFSKLLMRSVRKKILCGIFPMKKKMVKF